MRSEADQKFKFNGFKTSCAPTSCCYFNQFIHINIYFLSKVLGSNEPGAIKLNTPLYLIVENNIPKLNS